MAGRSVTVRMMVLAAVILAAGCGGGKPNEPEPPPTYDVQVSPDSLGLVPGDTARLTATTTSNGNPATPPGLQWVSSAPNVATVDQSGKVTAVGEGTAMVGADVTAPSTGGASDRLELP